MKIINLTPHFVVVRHKDKEFIFPSQGEARCEVKSELKEFIEIDGCSIPVYKNVFGEVQGLPESQDGVRYIVSYPVLQCLAGKRDDLIGPDTTPKGGVIRNINGQVEAVIQFQTV